MIPSTRGRKVFSDLPSTSGIRERTRKDASPSSLKDRTKLSKSHRGSLAVPGLEATGSLAPGRRFRHIQFLSLESESPEYLDGRDRCFYYRWTGGLLHLDAKAKVGEGLR